MGPRAADPAFEPARTDVRGPRVLRISKRVRIVSTLTLLLLSGPRLHFIVRCGSSGDESPCSSASPILIRPWHHTSVDLNTPLLSSRNGQCPRGFGTKLGLEYSELPSKQPNTTDLLLSCNPQKIELDRSQPDVTCSSRTGLIILWLEVRILQGPPIKSIIYDLRY